MAAEWFRSELGIEIPDPHVCSARDGYHIFFQLPDSFKLTKLKFPWGDLLVGNSQTVAPPSCFDGKPYRFFSKTTELYDGTPLLKLWPAKAERAAVPVNRELGKWDRSDAIELYKRCRAYSDAHPDDEGSLDRYHVWKELFAFAAGWEFGEVDGREVIDAASSDPAEMTNNGWASCCRDYPGNPVKMESIFKWAHDRGIACRVGKSSAFMFRDVGWRR